MSLNLNTSSTAQRGNNGELLGDINMQVKDPKTGISMFPPGYFGSTRSHPYYRPNEKFIKDNYITINGIQGQTFEQQAASKEKRRAAEAAFLSTTGPI